MKEVIFGGNSVRSWGNQVQMGNCTFSKSPYTYYTLAFSAGESQKINHPSCLIYFYTGSEGIVILNEKEVVIKRGDALFIGNTPVRIKARNDSQFFIVAGDPVAEAYFEHRKEKDLKVVTKPWGKEIWINHPKQDFSLKEIHINPGTKTSLQYHQFKTETNVVYSGEAHLYYKSNANIKNDEVSANDLGKTLLNDGDVIHVTPFHIHRLEAITHLTLLEASTNQLDDVIRLQDDFKRDHGRIESEHVKKS